MLPMVTAPVVTKAAASGPGDAQLTPSQDRSFVAGILTWIWAVSDMASLMVNAQKPPVIENDYKPPSLHFFGEVDLVFPPW